MVNARGQPLHSGRAVPAVVKGHVLAVEGLGEFSQKYIELARDFNRQSLAFHVFDRQGQGLSGRNSANPMKLHCDDFRDDVDDIEQYAMRKIPRDGTPLILLGHSTGGLLCIPALRRDQERAPHMRLFSGAVLTDPLLGFGDPRVKGREATIALLPLFGRKLREAFLPGAVRQWMRRDDPHARVTPAAYSTDAARAGVHDYWQTKLPALRVSHATTGWLQEMSRAITTTREDGYIEAISHPVTICTSDMKLYVDPDALQKTGVRFTQGKSMNFPEGRHELLMERDSIRNAIIQEVTRMALKP